MMIRVVVILVAAMAINTSWIGAASAGVLDQDNLYGTCCRISVIGPDVLQQTITGGIAGTLEGILVEVGSDVPYETFGTGIVTFSLYEGAAAPTSSPIFSEDIDITKVMVSEYLWNVTSQGFKINPGDVFTLGLTGLGEGDGATFADDIDDQYADGVLFLNGLEFEPSRDLAFRTYVIPVPEPSTFILILLGALGLTRRFG